MSFKKVAVFASGSGSNFQSLIDQNKKKKFCKLEILIASKSGILAIDRAEKNQIDSFIFNQSDFKDKSQMFEKIQELLILRQIDFIVLAGYLTILPEGFIKKFENKIINIHPSLLPKFGGKGFYGLNVHKAVIEAGERQSGCTVHYVNSKIDGGKIIMQSKVKVLKNDTPSTLQDRVLEKEHKLLPKALKKICKLKERFNEKKGTNQCF